jgi:ABC-type Fe2+-enterobactin transport system substrate-binding protein
MEKIQIQTQTKNQAKQQLNELRKWLKKLKRVLNQVPSTVSIYEFQVKKEKYLDSSALSAVSRLLWYVEYLAKRPQQLYLSDLLNVLVNTAEAIEQSFDYLDELIDLYGE